MIDINELPNARYLTDMLTRIVDLRFESARLSVMPSTIYKPRLFIDGNRWCALYGKNLHNGVAGFGFSPSQAYADFDHNWVHELGEQKEKADMYQENGLWEKIKKIFKGEAK